MLDQKKTTLTNVLSDVLANLAFMFTDDGEFDAPVGERWLETMIGYTGVMSGELRLVCSTTFAQRLAANLLGVDSGQPTTDQESNDAVKEFMNVVCGQYVTEAFGMEDVFNLTIPEVLELPCTPDFGNPHATSQEDATLSVDGQWIQLRHTQRA